MLKIFQRLLLLLALPVLVGCAAKIPHVVISDFDKRGTRLIAVMPIKHSTSDPKSVEMLRAKLVEELYFKGYPKIPSGVIDEKIAGSSFIGSGGMVSPQMVGEMLKVDAVLYPTLNESRMGSSVIYASTVAEAEFELFSAKTGESLWRVRHKAVYRNYGFTRKHLELKSSQVYEPAIQEVVTRALETLPDAGGL
ncbi:MAG: hypothetical protein C0390_10115 [Syntrophus sp. (in: bacteria)]|nr:hypothetical protein [Syntrophus sp. (in: bacteria)]